MSTRPRKRNFSQDELSHMLEEIEKNQQILFSKARGSSTNREKRQKWEDIGKNISACSTIQRTAMDIKKKWHDFSSQAKKKGAEIRKERAKTGGGQSSIPALSPEEERALAILGPTATRGISGGVDVCSNEFPSTPPQPTSPVHPSSASDSPASSPGPSVTQTSLRAPPTTETPQNTCACSEELILIERERLNIEKERLQLKREKLQQRERQHQELVDLKRAKLEIMAKQLSVAEFQLSRPAISVPIILPSEQGKILLPSNNSQLCLGHRHHPESAETHQWHKNEALSVVEWWD
uniref:Myb/SANT-like DNA-binding domain-containing protein n=1 Tax=Astyanax mexicanus TaxID=7994 RepID=A0A3B1IMG2_ASTMX